MTSYQPTFGGQPNQPAIITYQSYTYTGADSVVDLTWPLSMIDTASPAAAWMDVSGVPVSGAMGLPYANQGSLGSQLIVNNLGPNALTTQDKSGNTVASVAAGAAIVHVLRDNTFSAGLWRTVQYGASVAQAQAAALAGRGLVANGSLLQIGWSVTQIAQNYSVTGNDLATTLEWKGGNGTITYPTAASLGNGFINAVSNQGSGNVTVMATTNTIDGQASVVLAPGASCFVNSDGTVLVTIGRGQQAPSNVSVLNKLLPTSGTTQLSGSEINAQIQEFTGALAGAVSVIYNSTPNLYAVSNQTTGGQTVTFKSSSADTGVVVAQGANATLFNDGSTMRNAQSVGAGTVGYVGTGSGLTGGPITTSGVLDIATVSGAPGVQDMKSFVTDVYGRVTSTSGSPSFNALSSRALVIDQDRTMSSGVITLSGGKVRGQPYSLTWSGVIVIDLNVAHNFDLVAGSGSAQLTLSGTPLWGQGGMLSIADNQSGNAQLTFSPASTWFATAGVSLAGTPGGRTLIPYYVDSSTPARVVLSPLTGLASL